MNSGFGAGLAQSVLVFISKYQDVRTGILEEEGVRTEIMTFSGLVRVDEFEEFQHPLSCLQNGIEP